LRVADLHVEAARATGDGLSDAAEADDAELHPVDALAQANRIGPGFPAAGPDEPIALGDAARCIEEQPEGEICRRLGDDGRVRDCDMSIRASSEIDVVDADRHIRHDGKLRRAGEHLGVDVVGDHRHDSAYPRGARRERIGHDALLVVHDLERSQQSTERISDQAPTDEDRIHDQPP
jgi:hypothetical protein